MKTPDQDPVAIKPAPSDMRPDLIASGLGLASRQELCFLIALLETVGIVEAARGVGEDLVSRLGTEFESLAERLARASNEMERSPVSLEILRHRLWKALVDALDTRQMLPLSERRLAEEACALGVMTSKVLSPGQLALDVAKESKGSERPGFFGRMKDGLVKVYEDPAKLWRRDVPLSFPEIVERELATIIEGTSSEGLTDAYDPEITRALRGGGQQTWTAIAAGGGWVGMAAAVNAAGFAPYMLAAQASAFIPLVSGPALVSFLAVMVNPVTITAAIVALGGFGGHRISQTIVRQAAARVAVLLAVRGLQDPQLGLGITATSFRQMVQCGTKKPEHLTDSKWDEMRDHVSCIEAMIGRSLPEAPGLPPEAWRATPSIKKDGKPVMETAATAGLTAADLLFHAAAIDQRVLAGADFWRSADISNPLEFATHAAEFAVHGADIGLRGYTAEQVVLGNLIADGHDVSLPSSSSNPGYDLVVDGHEVQIKCGENLSLLAEHFERYPDIPVIANSELFGKLTDQPWADLVTTLDGFELSTVDELTTRAIEEGLDLASAEVLEIAIGVGALRGAFGVVSGEIPASQLPAWLVVDTALRGGLVLVGSQVGAVVGLIAIGPAGALIIGPALGAAAVFGTSDARSLADRVINPEWHGSMREQSEELLMNLRDDLRQRISYLRERQSNWQLHHEERSDGILNWMERRAIDDTLAAAELFLQLGKPPKTPYEAMRLDLLAARISPADPAVLKSRHKLRHTLDSRPGPLDGAINGVASTYDRYFGRDDVKA